MDDRELLAALEGLGLGRENHRAVLLLPLIEVAWADGRIQRAERRKLFAVAKERGLATQDGWLDRWLKRRPSKKVFLAAHTALLALMNRAGHEGDEFGAPTTLDELLDLCQEVAEVAGGLFGLAFTVTRAERECIEEIAAALQVGPALPEPVVSAWRDARDRRRVAEAPTSHRATRRGPRYGILDQTTVHLPTSQGRTAITAVPLAAEVIDDPTDPFDAWLARSERRPRASVSTAATDESPRPPARPPTPPAPKAPSRGAPRAGDPPSPIRVAVAPPKPARPATHKVGPTAERPPEEDPTLPFFDPVNIGTYALDPRRDDDP
jgi:hypothetical protein